MRPTGLGLRKGRMGHEEEGPGLDAESPGRGEEGLEAEKRAVKVGQRKMAAGCVCEGR